MTKQEQGVSKVVTTNQAGLHERLDEIVLRNLNNPFRKPIADHTQVAFDQVTDWLKGRSGELILDSCCGIGESSRHLANRYPDANVIAVDRSAHRLSKHENCFTGELDNLLFVRADLIDFWRLAAASEWRLAKHFILYPNPYPKSAQVQRRWHASPVFSDLLTLGGELTVRSNWRLYIEEFVRALALAGHETSVQLYSADQPMSAFERKYWESGQQSWQCVAQLSESGSALKP